MNPEIPPPDCGEYLERLMWRFAGAAAAELDARREFAEPLLEAA